MICLVCNNKLKETQLEEGGNYCFCADNACIQSHPLKMTSCSIDFDKNNKINLWFQTVKIDNVYYLLESDRARNETNLSIEHPQVGFDESHIFKLNSFIDFPQTLHIAKKLAERFIKFNTFS